MRRHLVLRTIRMKFPHSTDISLLILAVLYLFGGLVAIVCTQCCDKESSDALSSYLFDFCSSYNPDDLKFSFLHSGVLYFGGVALAFFFGFSSFGTVAIPLISAWMGFSSFFSAICFSGTFGIGGVFAAASLIAVRLLFTLPCFFSVSVFSWRFSSRLFAMLIGSTGNSERFIYPKRYFLLFLFCLLVLSVGMLCERFITPVLFHGAITRLNF